VAILADILLGTQLYWLAFVYTNVALGFFLVREAPCVLLSPTHTRLISLWVWRDGTWGWAAPDAHAAVQLDGGQRRHGRHPGPRKEAAQLFPDGPGWEPVSLGICADPLLRRWVGRAEMTT
jgi:hypothetical protein